MHPRLLFLFASLRTAGLRRGVAWIFLLSMAAAYASPVIAPRSIELLCSTNGAMRLLTQTADGEEAASEMHCGLCAPLIAPPPVVSAQSFAHADFAVPRLATASVATALTRPPLPPRGPPAVS